MDYYLLDEDLYRIQSDVGIDGEIFGGVFINDTPGILIGCSGGIDFVKVYDQMLTDLDFSGKIRIYLPSVTMNEIITLHHLRKKFSNNTIYVHKKIASEVSAPAREFLNSRYFISKNDSEFFGKKLPDTLDNVIGFDKTSSFETEKTKILLIPFSGPHLGHSLIYSRDHKFLSAGLLLGRTSNPYSYYIDKSGSLMKYESALSFLQKARSDIIFPVYDEPEYTKSLKFKAEDVSSAIETDQERIHDICSLKLKSLEEITSVFKANYVNDHQTSPYDRIDIVKTKVFHHLNELVNEKLVVKQKNQYMLNK